MCFLSKQAFLALEREAYSLELAIAKGEETDLTDARLAEIDQLMTQSDWMLSIDYGVIKKSVNGIPLKVLKSARGFYIGTCDEQQGPLSRESNEYWTRENDASHALESGQWTQFNYEI
ncbi:MULTISPECIES: hypothetical protein [unclassified Cellvibrio]|uniref:hypothetical protein n=1 Tax=unclassified Cellvibrio TaxID=2624793 RepID=UPI00351AA67C